jgi:hypothetical protein
MTEQQILSEIAMRMIRRWEERQGDMTKDPIDAEAFFDDLEEKASKADIMLAYLVNYYAVKFYGTLPIQNNPFLGD